MLSLLTLLTTVVRVWDGALLEGLAMANHEDTRQNAMMMEETLFRLLVRIYRQPEALLAWTNVSFRRITSCIHETHPILLAAPKSNDEGEGGGVSQSAHHTIHRATRPLI